MTTYSPQGLAFNTQYYVRVKHSGNSGQSSNWSPSLSFKTRTALAHTGEIKKFIEPSPSTLKNFGISCDISEDGLTLAIGCYKSIVSSVSRGAVYIYTRPNVSSSDWTQQARIFPSTGAADDWFGWSLSLSSDGNTIAVGSPLRDLSLFNEGSVFIFTRSGTTWTQRAQLAASDRQNVDQLGYSVGLSGNGLSVVCGAPTKDSTQQDTGAVYLFTRSGTTSHTWTQRAKTVLPTVNYYDQFGWDVSLSRDGLTMAVGCPLEDDSGADSGAVVIYTRASHTGYTWTERIKLVPPANSLGFSFGHSVALSQDSLTIVIGVKGYNVDANAGGAAYVYNRASTSVHTWTLQGILTPPDVEAGDQYGSSVAISADGSKVIVGSTYDDDMGSNSGGAYIYVRSGSTWGYQSKPVGSDITQSASFGSSVAISGNGSLALVGASGARPDGLIGAGAAYLFNS